MRCPWEAIGKEREGGEGGRPARAGLDAEVDRFVAGLWQDGVEIIWEPYFLVKWKGKLGTDADVGALGFVIYLNQCCCC